MAVRKTGERRSRAPKKPQGDARGADLQTAIPHLAQAAERVFHDSLDRFRAKGSDAADAAYGRVSAALGCATETQRTASRTGTSALKRPRNISATSLSVDGRLIMTRLRPREPGPRGPGRVGPGPRAAPSEDGDVPDDGYGDDLTGVRGDRNGGRARQGDQAAVERDLDRHLAVVADLARGLGQRDLRGRADGRPLHRPAVGAEHDLGLGLVPAEVNRGGVHREHARTPARGRRMGRRGRRYPLRRGGRPLVDRGVVARRAPLTVTGVMRVVGGRLGKERKVGKRLKMAMRRTKQ